MPRFSLIPDCLFLSCALAAPRAFAEETDATSATALQSEPSPTAVLPSPSSDWHYGAYLDVSYIVNFNFPDNDLWRSRSTAAHHNKLAPNMALAYVRKDATESSRWGMELGVQGGFDSEEFAFLPGEQKVDGADVLRHFHRANASYLAPVGKGLTITAGLFNSLMG